MTKVFVGNLSFKTTEAELASEFTAAGRVKTANIITRGPRSLGYGFVELETEEEAKRSVELLNKKVIDSREINVEVAKPRDETAVAERVRTNPPANRGAARGGRGGGPGARGGRGGNRGGNRGGDGNAGDGAGAGAYGNRRFRGGSTRGGADGGAGGRPNRVPRANNNNNTNNNANRTPSKSTLFVANLPFSVDDARLNEIFTSAGVSVSKAHVVTKRNGRSKGFGFVEFTSEADQQKALAAVEKKKVDDRELIVKVALTEAPSDHNKADGATSTTTTSSKDAEKKEDKKEEKQEEKEAEKK